MNADQENQLILAENQQELFFSTSQLKKGNYTLDDITRLINKSNYANFKLNMDGINKALQYLSHTEDQKPPLENSKSFLIANRYNAQLKIALDPSKLVAKAEIISAFGGASITEKQLRTSLKKLNVTIGIRDSAIKLLIKKSDKSSKGTRYSIVVARGEAAEDGSDTSFNVLTPPPKDELIKTLTESGSAFDLSNLEDLITVQQGASLIRRFPHKKGKEGITVTGETISCLKGKDIPFRMGENTKVSEHDPNLVIASVAGVPIETENGIGIEPLLVLDNLENNSETFHHTGNLIITGDITPGNKIVATGNISIFGFIESSHVKCGGDLFVSKGIIGEQLDEDNSEITCEVNCAGNLYASFIQYSRIYVVQNLNVQRQLLHSHVSCSGYVTVQDKTKKRGAIFGGVIYAKEGLRTVNLGATSGVKTVINLTPRFSQLAKRKKALYESLEKIEEALANSYAAQSKIVNLERPKEADKQQELKKLETRLALTIQDYKKHRIETTTEIQLNQDKIHSYFFKIKLHASNTIFNNVSVAVGDDTFYSKKQRFNATTVRMKNNQLIADIYNE